MADPTSSRALQLAGYGSFLLLGWNTVLTPSLIRSIETDFHQSDASIGLLLLLASISYGGAAFLGGTAMERFGRRKVLVAAALLETMGMVVAALTPVWLLFIVARILASAGNSIVDAGMNAVFLDLFQDTRGGALNLLHLFFSAGAFLAPLPIGILVAGGVSWHLLLLVTALPYAVLAAILSTISMPMHHRPERISQPPSRLVFFLPVIGLGLALALYTGAEIGVSSWMVRLLAKEPLTIATAALSIFWLGLTGGRLLSGWAAERVDYSVFAASTLALGSLFLAGGVISPNVALVLLCFALCGVFFGPAYPTIFAIAGAMYPRRASALSGALTSAGATGVLVYPPMIGFMASRIGIAGGVLGAAVLGLLSALCIMVARHLPFE